MIQDLQATLTHNQNLKKEFKKQKDEYLVEIYKGLIQNKPIRQIHKELYESTINHKNKVEKAYAIAYKGINKIAKAIPKNVDLVDYAKRLHPMFANQVKKEIDAIPIIIFEMLKKTDKEMEKAFNEERQHIIDERKEKIIKDDLEKNRNLDTPKVFYLCSEHRDCAKDHIGLQGKIYIDEKWEELVGDEYKDQVRLYIAQHNTITFQAVTHRPYWLITRPHCRHYFKAIDTKQVLEKSVKRLVRKYNMHRLIGDRQYLQTLDSGVGTRNRKLIGELRNAEIMQDKYKDRLVTFEKLYQVKKSPIIHNAIVKTKFLIQKWGKYIKELKGE